MGNYKNKAMGGKEMPKKKIVLVCVVDCMSPSDGSWKKGDIVDQEETIKKLTGNPYFIEKEID